MPPIAAAGIVAGGALAGGILSNNAKQAAADQQASIGQQAAQGYRDIDIPTIQQQQVQLQQIANAGNLTPEQEQIFQQNQSVLNNYQQNQSTSTAQSQALQGIMAQANAGGLTATDKANLNEILTAAGNQDKQARAAALQSLQQRGMSGSGMELATMLAGNQDAATNAANAGFQTNAQALVNKLNALGAGGQMAGSQAQQQFGQAATQAGMQNAINASNTANLQNVTGQNVARNNYSQERNLNNTQQLDSANTNIANQGQIYNQGLYQQNFGNQLQKEQGVANALNKVSNAAAAQGEAGAALGNAIGQGASKLGSATGTYLAGQPSDSTSPDEAVNAMKPNSTPESLQS